MNILHSYGEPRGFDPLEIALAESCAGRNLKTVKETCLWWKGQRAFDIDIDIEIAIGSGRAKPRCADPHARHEPRP